MSCVFCKIINGEIPTEKVYEDETCIIFKDIEPIAPIHLLMVPKKHYARLEEATVSEAMELSFMLNKLAQMKDELGLEKGYRLIINQGENGGQTVGHLHIHILGGKKLSWQAWNKIGYWQKPTKMYTFSIYLFLRGEANAKS